MKPSNRPYTVLTINDQQAPTFQQEAYEAFNDPGGIIHTMSEYRGAGGGYTTILDLQNASGVLFIFGAAYKRNIAQDLAVGQRVTVDGTVVIDRQFTLTFSISRSFLSVGAMIWSRYSTTTTDRTIMDMKAQPLHFDSSLKLEIYAEPDTEFIAFQKHYLT